MPETLLQKTETEQKPEKKLSIIEQRSQLFERIVQSADALDREDLVNLVSRVFEHSTEDGLLLAERLDLSKQEIADVLSSPIFIIKHRDLIYQITAEMSRVFKSVDSASKHILAQIATAEHNVDEGLQGDRLNPFFLVPDPYFNQATFDLGQEVDQLYIQFLKTKNVKEKQFNDPRSKGEAIAEDYLEKLQQAIGGYYYAGSVKKEIFKLLSNSGWAKQGIAKEIFNDNINFISQEAVQDVCLQTDLNFKDLEPKISRHQFKLDAIVENLDRQKAVSELKTDIALLVGELSNNLANRGEVVFDKQIRQYRVEFKKSKITPEISKKPEKIIGITEFDGVYYPIEVAGKLYFKAKVGDKWIIADEQGNRYGEEFDWVGPPAEIAGKLYFRAEAGNKSFIADKQGNRYGEEFDDVDYPTEVAGKLYFQARVDDKWIITDKQGNRYGEEFDWVGSPAEIAGKLYFRAEVGDKWIIADEQGNRYGEEFDSADSPTEVADELYFRAQVGGKYFITDEQGNRYGEEFDSVGSHTEVAGKLYFWAKVGNKSFIADEQGNHYGEEFDNVSSPTEVAGKLYFRAQADNKSFIVDEQGNRYGEEFDGVGSPTEVAGKLYFWAETNGEKAFYAIDVSSATNKLTQSQEQQLSEINHLANLRQLVANPQLELVGDYFKDQSKLAELRQDPQKAIKHFVEHSPKIAASINALLHQQPELFLNTMAAKKDRAVLILAKRITAKLFPEILTSEKPPRNFDGYLGMTETESQRPPQPTPESLLSAKEFCFLESGYGEMHNNKQEVMTWRYELNEMVVSGLYSSYSQTGHNWKKVEFPVDSLPNEPIIENTAVIPLVVGLSEVALVKPVNTQVIEQRVHGLTQTGEEIPLKIKVDSLGQVEAKIKGKAEQLTYSVAMSQAPETIADISLDEHQKYKSRFEDSYGGDLTESLAQLPEEIEFFLDSISDLKPKEQVMAIESFVRQAGYYDFDNEQVIDLMRGQGIEEKLMVMEARTEELKAKNPELAEKLKSKKYAGVCADFANLTTAVLRRAGFLAGIATGFGSDGKRIEVRHAHATSFVVWPTPDGQNKIFLVDGTPTDSDDPRMTSIAQPSLKEKESQRKEQLQKALEISEEQLEEIMAIVKDKDADAIRQLSNGELEQVLNVILKYRVKKSHLNTLENIFNYYWYTPAKGVDLSDNQDREKLKADFQKEMAREKRKSQDKQEPQERAGQQLFQMVELFGKKFVKAGQAENFNQSLNILEQLVEITENDLSDTEKKAAYAVITYLKAKKMAGDNSSPLSERG